MTTREKMVKYREKRGLTIADMAERCRIGVYLMAILEDGAVTTPKLVPQIAEQYGLDELEAEELMPEHLRPHGGDYDPERYIIRDHPRQHDRNEQKARNAIIVERLKEGMSTRRVAEEFGISQARVCGIFKAAMRKGIA